MLVLQLCLRACLGLALSDHIAGRVGKEPRRPTRSKHLQEAFHTRICCVPQGEQLEKSEAQRRKASHPSPALLCSPSLSCSQKTPKSCP